ncbi:MAG: Ldh family oxidoreductase [Acutalibacteraceae bacterium]|nr:Ldh family oxidoreductase [Acutalibacteraceae bacterium]
MSKIDFLNQKEQVKTKLTENGVKETHAEIVADCFVTADMYGVTSHGTAILPAHIQRIERGGYNLDPKFDIIRETTAFAIIDGDNSMGPVCASFCMNYAVEKSRESGIFTVLSRNNNTFGPAFYYPLTAAQKGYIGIAFSNSPAQMAPFGGKEKMLGTNPFSMVIPCGEKDPIIIDMATSVVAKSKFKEYKAQNKSLPEGWALDINGKPTTDPDEAMAGLVLPMAGFKGYGIAMMIDILSGVISGAAYLNKVGRFYSENNACMDVGFTFIAIDPKVVFGEEYEKIMEKYVDALRNSEATEGCTISLPGDDRLKHLKENS